MKNLRMLRGTTLGVAVMALAGTAILSHLSPAASQNKAEEPVLNIYNWSDYIAPEVIPMFEKETGIKVTYDVYDSNEVLEAKILAGNTGYDIVVPTDSSMIRQIRAGAYQPLDRSKIPNWTNLDPKFVEEVNKIYPEDPVDKYGAIYFWGTVGIGTNVSKVEERIPNAPVDSLDLIFKPENAAKLADCGIVMLDSPVDIIPMALNYLGKDPHSEKPEDIEAAKSLLLGIRPHIRYFHSSRYIEDLANGEVCVAIGWSGDIIQAADRASEADRGIEIQYAIPTEGTLLWFDIMGIPKDAPHPENAHKFIDFILRPEVSAMNTNYVYFPNANKASYDLIENEIRNDPTIYPPQEVIAKLFSNKLESLELAQMRADAWDAIKAGQ